MMATRRRFWVISILLFILLFLISTICVVQFNLHQWRQNFFSCRFVVFSDCRGSGKRAVNQEVLHKILQEIKNLNPQPAYIIVPGDLVKGNSKLKSLKSQFTTFKELFATYYPLEMLLPTVGNHEVGSKPDFSREKLFGEMFREFETDDELSGYNRTVYYVDYGEIRFILLNSCHYKESNRITGQQLAWFSQVAEDPKTHKFVFLHAPPYPTGAHIGSSLDAYPEDRDRFWEIIDQNDIRIVFAGHEHHYSRRIIDQTFGTKKHEFTRAINQVVVGSAGATLNDTYSDNRGVVVPPIPKYHYMVIDVQNNYIHAQVFSIAGELLDQFTLN